MRPRVVALGNDMASDDGAAMGVARLLEREGEDVALAGRPGPSLLDLLTPPRPVVLLDVVRTGRDAGSVVWLPLDELADLVSETRPREGISSHGFGAADALRLARALDRQLPPGVLVGVEGRCFEPGESVSPVVEGALAAFAREARRAIDELSTGAES